MDFSSVLNNMKTVGQTVSNYAQQHPYMATAGSALIGGGLGAGLGALTGGNVSESIASGLIGSVYGGMGGYGMTKKPEQTQNMKQFNKFQQGLGQPQNFGEKVINQPLNKYNQSLNTYR